MALSRVVFRKVFIIILFAVFAILLILIFELELYNSGKASSRQNKEEDVQSLRLRTAESASFDDDNRHKNTIIIYNRIPKTGSTSFVNVAYDICKSHNFSVIHLNITKNSHTMSLADQGRFVYNVTHWTARKPALYHGHVGFIDFAKFGERRPMYINILRDPLQRLISYYYFLRYGDDYRPYLIRSRHGDTLTFDECVMKKGRDCHPNNMWMQIPFLCGQSAACWVPGNPWALEEAKRNLINQYLVVGVTDEIANFIAVLESVVPSFFRGATSYFLSSRKNHLRKTNKKIEPSSETLAEIKKSVIWKMENELYEFAYQQFQQITSHMLLTKNGTLKDKGKQFRFEKIYPKLL